MLSEREVINTLNMLRNEHLDVRTVTLGVSLFDCVSHDIDLFTGNVKAKLHRYASQLVNVCNEVGDKYGIPVVNKRISVSPIAVVGAEPYTVEFRRRIEELFDMKAYNSYGLSEMNGPGVAFECQNQNGLHVWEDAYLPEVVDPKTGEPVPDGEIGELVMTCLCRQGMPILRYRTRDLTRFLPGECSCGRHHRRIDRILGRADDMFIIKGVNVYPMQIEQVIMTFPEVGQNYCILLENDGIGDVMRVQVEIRDEYFVEDMRCLQGLQKTIAQRLRDEILVTPRVELVQSNSLPSSEGKAVRVYDNRAKK
jgi:phenylacetate-CoA ligase